MGEKIGGIVFGFFLLALLVGLFLDGGSDKPNTLDAWVMSQKFVEDRLKSPGTADFGWQTAEKTVHDLGGGRYRVRGWVDSQNTFGALVRTRFACELHHAGGGRWVLDDLDFE